MSQLSSKIKIHLKCLLLEIYLNLGLYWTILIHYYVSGTTLFALWYQKRIKYNNIKIRKITLNKLNLCY